MWIVRSKQILWAPKSSLHYRQKSSGQTASRPPSHWWWTSLGCNPLQQPPQPPQLLQHPQQLVTMISRRNISSRWLFLAPSLVVFLLLFSLFSYVFAADGERIFGLVIRDILLISLYFSCLYFHISIFRSLCSGSGSSDFTATSTKISTRQSGVMAEGAAFRSFKDTVRVFLFNSLSIAGKVDNS